MGGYVSVRLLELSQGERHMCCVLTLTTLLANSAGEKWMILFAYISEEIGSAFHANCHVRRQFS